MYAYMNLNKTRLCDPVNPNTLHRNENDGENNWTEFESIGKNNKFP